MAHVVLDVASDLTAINLHETYPILEMGQTGWDMTPQQVVNRLEQIGIPGGVAYDVSEGVDSAYHFGTDSLNVDLFGEGINLDWYGNNHPDRGTITSIINSDDTGIQSYFYYINVSAVAFDNAIASVSIADDAAIFAQMFADDDIFDLSRGADKANGMGGNDLMLGMGGNDTLFGGAGNDRINGGAGRDLLSGNAGADRFIFTAINHTGASAGTADRITDFTHGTDRIDLHLIDASGLLAGNNAFSFIGTAAFGTGSGGQIRFAQFDAAGTAGDYTLIYLDTDADTAAEAVIRLNGLVTLTAADFVL